MGRILTLILVTILFVACSSIVLSTNEDGITEIRKLYQEVGKRIQNNQLIETRMDLVANDVSNVEVPVDLAPIYRFYWSAETQRLVKPEFRV